MRSGRPKPEGTVVFNRALSVTLGTVRLAGADGFYTGAVAAASGRRVGGRPRLRPANWRPIAAARARRATAIWAPINAAVPGPATGAGAFIASVMSNVGGANPEVATVAALRKTLAGFNIQPVPPDLGATGFAALDANGQAAACAVTMNGPFGAGAQRRRYRRDVGGLAVIAGRHFRRLPDAVIGVGGGQMVLAGAGSGGPNGSGAIVYALLRLAAGPARWRGPATALHRPGAGATVNTIACQNGLCVALPDPGGNGLGATGGSDQSGTGAA